MGDIRPHTVFFSVALAALSACQTVKPDADKTAEAQDSTQSSRLIKLAQDIEARGESGTAIALYQRATAMPDAKPITFVKTGDAYLRAGNPEEAVKAYRAALAKSPSDGQALLGLGSAMLEVGDVEAGMQALSQAAPMVNTAQAYNRLGVAQTFAGQTGEAQNTFAQALKLAPNDLDIETNLALAAALEGNTTTALPIVERVGAASDAQLYHKRNVVIIYGLLGLGDQVKSAPPTGLTTEEIHTLVARAKSIRAKNTVQARAKALGSMAA